MPASRVVHAAVIEVFAFGSAAQALLIGNRYAPLHVGMEFAVVIDLARFLQQQSRALVRADHHIPVVVVRGGGMGKPVLVDPFAPAAIPIRLSNSQRKAQGKARKETHDFAVSRRLASEFVP